MVMLDLCVFVFVCVYSSWVDVSHVTQYHYGKVDTVYYWIQPHLDIPYPFWLSSWGVQRMKASGL